MNREEFEKWKEEFAEGGSEHYYCNTLSWLLVPCKDGWVAVFEIINGCYYIPIIQAATMEKAKTYCYMVEPIPPDVQVLCPNTKEPVNE